MVAKDTNGNKTSVPGLILSNNNDVRRFINCIKQIALKKEQNIHEKEFDYNSKESLESLKKHNIRLELQV